jgi:hypothetical protein
MRRRGLLQSIAASTVLTGGTATSRNVTSDRSPSNGSASGGERRRSRDDYETRSLRSIAEQMDGEAPARRLRGNGPPFADDRPEPFESAILRYDRVTVDEDERSKNPPKSVVVSGGPVDVETLDGLTTYSGVRYLDAPDPGSDWSPSSARHFSGTAAGSDRDVYRYNLLFSAMNAHDLGMVNRTHDNDSLPAGYTDKGLIESHRWVPAEESGQDHRSLRNVVERHQEGARHRVLWQNAKLPLSDGTVDPTDPKLARRASALGDGFGTAGYDVVGLCEVYNDDLLDEMEEAYGRRYPSTDRDYGYPQLHDLGVLIGERHLEESGVRRVLGDGDSAAFEASGPTAGTAVNFEGWQHVPIRVPELPGEPAFELVVTHLQAVIKGAGPDTNEDAKQHAKLEQLEELKERIESLQDRHGERPVVLMGDFNIHSRGRGGQYGDDSGVRGGQYYTNFMDEMGWLGLEEAWLTYGGPNADCEREADGYTCDSFTPRTEGYYRGDRLDYVFIERPRERHDLHLDVDRMRSVEFHDDEFGALSDHHGLGFELLTSPA